MTPSPGFTPRVAAVWSLLGLGALVVACEEDAPVRSVVEVEAFGGADMITMDGTHTITNAEGIRTAFLRFDTMFQWDDSTQHALRGVNLTVFDEDSGSERGTVTSVRGLFDPRGESLTAQGTVVLVLPAEGRRLETEELHYDPDAGQLWSDSAFTLYEGGQVRQGRSFTTDLELQNFRVCGTAGGGC